MAYISVHEPEPEPTPTGTSGWLSFALGLVLITTALAGTVAYYLIVADVEPPRQGQRSPPVALRELPQDFPEAGPMADGPPMTLASNPLSRAAELIQNEKWQEAAELYEKYLQHQPNVGQAWHFLGLARLKLGAFDRAIIAWKNAARFPGLRPIALYNLACAHALKNDVSQGLDYFEQAMRVGFDQFDLIDTDSDLDALRSDPRFAEAIGRARSMSAADRTLPPPGGEPAAMPGGRQSPPSPGKMIRTPPAKEGRTETAEDQAEPPVIFPGNIGGRSGSRPPTSDQMPKPGDPNRPIPVRAPGSSKTEAPPKQPKENP